MKTLRPINTSLLASSRSSSLQRRVAPLVNTRPRHSNHDRLEQRRAFVSNPLSGPQHLTASRILHYPARVIYDVISDVASYSHYVPYCQNSVVTKTSSPTSDGKTYPEEAKLVIGLNDNMSEEFWSRVYCVPETVVEAVSGNADTTLFSDEIKHHTARPPADQDPSRKDTILSHLLTRWTLRQYPYKPPPASATHPESTHKNHQETSSIPGQQKTEVNLAIEYQFSNPVYGALSQAAAPKVAEKMIEAFEKRVKAIMEGPGHV